VISLFAVQDVFVFNNLGVTTLKKIFSSDSDFPKLVGYEAPMAPQRALPYSMGSGMHSLPGTLPGPPVSSGDSHRAKKNAVECQNLKALYRGDTKTYLEFVGAMEDLGGDHVIASVQRAVPLSLLSILALKPVNMRKTLSLMFQVVVPDDAESAKAISGLHLTHFRYVTSGVASFAQIKACYLNFKHVVCAIIGNADGFYFMENMFAPSLERLNSVEEHSMSRMEPSVVKHELSVRLVSFSKVLGLAAGLADDDSVFLGKLHEALRVDEAALLQKNFWSLSTQMNRVLIATKQEDAHKSKKPKWQGKDFGQAASPGSGVPGKPSGPGKGVGYCVAELCFKYLEAGKVYDNKPLQPCIHGNVCNFNHKIPNAPVTVDQKAEFMNLSKLLAPEKKAALLVVMNKPTFTK
jgi:hypothetical protein